MRNKAAATALALISVVLMAILSTGCIKKSSISKMDLTGQLKRLNQQVSGLNDKTSSLLEVIVALDEKESQLATSVELMTSMDSQTAQQISTTRKLASIVSSQKSRVADVLGLGKQVLTLESGLKESTQAQLGMAGSTLELVNALLGNLGSFRDINNGINRKMDRALQIMRSM